MWWNPTGTNTSASDTSVSPGPQPFEPCAGLGRLERMPRRVDCQRGLEVAARLGAETQRGVDHAGVEVQRGVAGAEGQRVTHGASRLGRPARLVKRPGEQVPAVHVVPERDVTLGASQYGRHFP